MKRVFFAALLAPVFSVMAFAPRLSAQALGFPALDPDPRALEYAGRAEYSWQDIGDIALWASVTGIEGASGGAAEAELIRNAVGELLSMPDLGTDPKTRGESVLTFMHRRFLKGYTENQTRLDEIFRTGRYNCVSSAALYTIFAVAAGLDVRGVMTRDHAFVTVNTGTELIDVETTNRIGFDPGNRREFHDGFGKLTGYAYVPARNYRDRIAISQLELVSLILSNRISELERRNRYAEAVPLAINRAALLRGRRDPQDRNPAATSFFTDPQQDLTERLLNYGSSLMKAGQEEEALQWAAQASSRYPDGERWQEFNYAALNNLVVKHIRSQHPAEARSALNAHAAVLTADNFNRLETVVLDAELMQRAMATWNGEEAETLLLAIDEALDRGVLAERRARELRSFVVLKEGERLSSSEGSSAALSYIETALAKYGRDAQMEGAVRVYRNNRIAELHNAFAGLYNQGDYEGAARHIRAALEEFPGNRNLTQDLNLAEKALREGR
jgi:tetratricopeptide (TPR) repeat protein